MSEIKRPSLTGEGYGYLGGQTDTKHTEIPVSESCLGHPYQIFPHEDAKEDYADQEAGRRDKDEEDSIIVEAE